MSVVHNLDKLVEWVEENICKKIKLKLPDDEANDTGYTYKLVNPSAFPMIIPTKDKFPPKIAAPIPSVCVQILEGKDMKNFGTTKIRLCLAAWSSGTHGEDILIPQETKPQTYVRWNTEEAKAFYERNLEGWRDAWNFLDVALRAVESVETIDSFRIVKENGIEYGPFVDADQNDVLFNYPYWFAWITFYIEYKIIRNNYQYEQFL